MQFRMLPVPLNTTEHYRRGSRGCEGVYPQRILVAEKIRNVIAYLVNEIHLSGTELSCIYLETSVNIWFRLCLAQQVRVCVHADTDLFVCKQSCSLCPEEPAFF